MFGLFTVGFDGCFILVDAGGQDCDSVRQLLGGILALMTDPEMSTNAIFYLVDVVKSSLCHLWHALPVMPPHTDITLERTVTSAVLGAVATEITFLGRGHGSWWEVW